jgi:hypothetical protein
MSSNIYGECKMRFGSGMKQYSNPRKSGKKGNAVATRAAKLLGERKK